MSEVRLIDADKLKEELKEYFSDGTLDSVSAKLAFNMILRKIDEAPTVKTYCYFCGQTEHGKIEERTQGDLIKRNLAIAYATSGLVRRIDGEDWIKTSEVKQSLNDVPTVEQPQGEWVDYSNEGYVECPFCGSATNCEDNKDELHYCWNCGAQMKGGAEE